MALLTFPDNHRLRSRQQPQETTTFPNGTVTSTTSSGVAQGTKLPVAAVAIPIAVGAALFIALIFWSWRRKMREGLPPRSSSRPNLTQARSTVSTSRAGFDTIPATESQSSSGGTQSSTSTRSQRFWTAFLAAFRADRPDTDAIHNAAQGIYGPQGQAAAAAARHSPSQRRSRRRRARQNNDQLRRTESGRSILTVPEYKTDVSEGEVMLYKAADESAIYSMDALTADISEQQTDDFSDQSDGGEGRDEVQASTAAQGIAASLRNSLRRSLNRGSASRASRASSRRDDNGGGDDIDESQGARNADPRQVRSEMVELGPMEELAEEEAAAEARRSMSQLSPAQSFGVSIPEDEAPDYDMLFPATGTDSAVSRPTSMVSNESSSTPSRVYRVSLSSISWITYPM